MVAYKARGELPPHGARARLSDLAEERGDALLREGQSVAALRHYSLATLLADGNAHLRRKTEKLRERIFPRPPGT